MMYQILKILRVNNKLFIPPLPSSDVIMDFSVKMRWIPILIASGIVLLAILYLSMDASGEGDRSEPEDHEISGWVRINANLAIPGPDEGFEIIVSIEVLDNGSWKKETNDTFGELINKPDSPGASVIDEQNGTINGISLHTDEPGSYRVWAGLEQNEEKFWNFTNITIYPKNKPPVSIALIGTDNRTTWTTNLTLWIIPGNVVTIYFNGSISYDPEGKDLDFFWDIDDTPPTNDFSGAWGVWNFSIPKTYIITLTVGDGNLTSTSNVILTIHYSLYPDLMVSEGPSVTDVEFETGEKVELTAIIYNGGNETAGPFKVYLYDINLNNSVSKVVYRKDIEGLEMNEYHGINFVWNTTITLTDPGIHVLRIIIDPENGIKEENESNNEVIGHSFLVLPGIGFRPDIHILDMNISSENPVIFQTVNVTLQMRNDGDATAHWVRVVLLVNGEEYDFRYVKILEVGQESKQVMIYSPSLLGSYNLTCVVFDELGMEHQRMGKRIEIRDIEGPKPTDGNITSNDEDSSDLDWLMIGVGIFMIAMAIVINIIGNRARSKK